MFYIYLSHKIMFGINGVVLVYNTYIVLLLLVDVVPYVDVY